MKIKAAVLREPNKPYSIEELELELLREKRRSSGMLLQDTAIPTFITFAERQTCSCL